MTKKQTGEIFVLANLAKADDLPAGHCCLMHLHLFYSSRHPVGARDDISGAHCFV